MTDADSGRAQRNRAWALAALQERSPENHGWAVGTCLWPFVLPGQQVDLEQRDPKAGEVVAYRSGGAVRAHRVLVVGQRELIIRADRPGSVLERVPRDQLLGVWNSQKGSRFNPFLTSAVGRLLAPALLALSSPVAFASLRRLARWPAARGGDAVVEVARGPASQLARELSLIGLTPPGTDLGQISDTLLGTTGFALLARKAGRPVGGLQVVPERNGELQVSVGVQRRERGRGVERLLLERCLAEAERRAVQRLCAIVRRGDFYLRNGLRDVGFVLDAVDQRRRAAYEEPVDEFVWRNPTSRVEG